MGIWKSIDAVNSSNGMWNSTKLTGLPVNRLKSSEIFRNGKVKPMSSNSARNP